MSLQAYQFQWQNPELRTSIYPYREQKLRDFLLAYEEVDLWQAIGSQAVDPRDEFELTHEYARLKSELDAAKQADQAVQGKIREILRSKPLRDLAQVQINLRSSLLDLGSKKASLERRVAWYVQFAPEHPYCQKWKAELDRVDAAYGEKLSQLQVATLTSLSMAASAMLAAASAALPGVPAGSEVPSAGVQRLTEALKEIPPPDQNGRVNQAAAVRWRMVKRKRELEGWDHDRLLAAVLERFDDNPQRYPEWLQYMVVHFSGMRYKSAHGSWASPKDLLETLEIEDLKKWVRNAPSTELDSACAAVIADLQKQRAAAPRPVDAARIDIRIAALQNPAARQEELLNARIPAAVENVRGLTDEQAEARLKARQGQFPDWAWKEIVSRTGLRVTEVTDSNWEALDPARQSAAITDDDAHWREIMNAWERKDITAWREEHAATLDLIVTRAVCNEVAEHIQHLRGVKPAAGLSAKPEWYMQLERSFHARPEKLLKGDRSPYFRPPGSQAPEDFRPGASILWLGWVTQQPNAWQVARPLPGIELVPAPRREMEVRRGAARRAQKETWDYRTDGGNFVRVAGPGDQPKSEKRPQILPNTGSGDSQSGQGKEWLRWTHEAIIVDRVLMAGNVPTLLTFEPVGRIGLNRRTLGGLQNSWEIFLGYIPNFYKLVVAEDQVDARAQAILAKLGEMLDRSKILLRPAPAAPSFGLVFDEGRESAALTAWKSLTPREQQVVALANRELPIREIAQRVGVSRSTVKRDLARARGKFGVANRTELRRSLARIE